MSTDVKVFSFAPLTVALMLTCAASMHATPAIVFSSPDSDGVPLIGPDSPQFQAALSLSRNLQADALLPYAAVLQNHTNQTIIAYVVRWECQSKNGIIVPRELALWNFNTYHGGNAIAPGESRIVSSVVGVGTGSVRSFPAYLADIGRVRQFFESQATVDISVDLIVFEDGRTIGRNASGWRERLKAHLDAEADIGKMALSVSDSPDKLHERLIAIRDEAYELLPPAEMTCPLFPCKVDLKILQPKMER